MIITSHGTDGACAAAMVLQKNPKLQIVITSARRMDMALEEIIGYEKVPEIIHICGVGIFENLKSVIRALGELKRKKRSVFWYCGRTYLDEYADSLRKVCKPIFQEYRSNTELIFNHLKLPTNPTTDLLRILAEQYVDSSMKRSDEEQIWHDLIEAGAHRYFKYEDRNSYVHVIRKVAGLVPFTEADREEVESYRKYGKSGVPLGNSKAMKQLRSLIKRLGPLEEPVLVLGPTGSGKEIAARLLHEVGKREGLFVSVNCAILSTNADLAHDRLFGHIAGAYTGATESRAGAFETADGGTLFLDEVAELPLPVQTQLLRVLEEGTITPLGTMKSHTVHVRIIAATNQDVPSMIRDGRFRMDLYHRLNVLTLRAPSLMERRDDMKTIARSVMYDLKKKGHPLDLSPADWKAINNHSWPGNIREFINILKRAAYMKMPVREVLNEEIEHSSGDPHHRLPKEILRDYKIFRPESINEALPEEEIRKSYMRHVLKLFDGNITRTADALKVSKNTLKKWLSD
ncbi:MAG: sigma-54-dependent Fis family transcriptional regulator [Candidatus Omnitrophota bacterium]|jgi:DNA-binding NtrC family response regulator|nr:MAG: sigma-54-dependent Fis family transcriptional regulator [Candidatus Omnitrophota bacterium]